MDALLSQLARETDARLLPLLDRKRPIALFDFPDHSNVGDSAIWLGLDAFLRRHSFLRPQTVEAHDVYPRQFPDLPTDCQVILHGGGNLGDIWPHHQKQREAIIQRYTQHRIVQMPQSVHFQSPENLQHWQQVCAQHPDLHVVVRDEASLNIARTFPCRQVVLCPDLALSLGPLQRPVQPTRPLLCLLRLDHESSRKEATPAMPEGAVVADWLDEPPSLTLTAKGKIKHLTTRFDWLRRPLRPLRSQLFNCAARERLARGCRQLSEFHFVITDRLHVHVLCALLGIPHVVLDNSYGKISRFRTTWNFQPSGCYSATNLEEALQTYRQYASR